MKFTKKLWGAVLLILTFVCLLAAACGGNGGVELRFDTKGGPAVESVTVEAGTEVELPAPSAWDGHVFEGWYTDEAFTGLPVEKVTAEESTTFYAKWSETYLLTLQIEGSAAQTYYLKEGTNLSEYLKDIVPTREGYRFNGWLLGDTDLPVSKTMGKEPVTLTAKWQVRYTVEVYEKALEGDTYTKRAEDIVGYADITGQPFTPNFAVEGFTVVKHDGEVRTLTLTDDYAKNVFRIYCDRNAYDIVLVSNYPEGAHAEKQVTLHGLYGTELELPAGEFERVDGYLLTGWSTRLNGEAELTADVISENLFDGAEPSKADKLTVTGYQTLYAVWTKCLTDMFGGYDRLYVIGDSVYIDRAGIYFKGEYTAETGNFRVYASDEEILLRGRIYSDGTYAYASSSRDDYTAALFRADRGIIEEETIEFDEYNGIIYYTDNGGVGDRSDGTYVIEIQDGIAYYLATFTTGKYKGQTLTITRNLVRQENGTRNVFRVRNDEEYGWGRLARYAVSGTSLQEYQYYLILDGFGTATYGTQGTADDTSYLYTREGDRITLRSSSSAAAVATLQVNVSGASHGFVEYNANLDHTFENGTAALKLDGLYTATYTSGKTVVSGYYTATASYFGGYIVRLRNANGADYTFLARSDSRNDLESGETVVTHTFETRLSGYAEYYYRDSLDGFYRIPMLVFGEERNKISVYGLTEAGEFAKVMVGSYTQDGSKYTFTREKLFDVDVIASPFDLKPITGFVFEIGSASTSIGRIDVTYWYSYTTAEGNTERQTVYRVQGGDQELIFVSGFVVLHEDGKYYTGSYTTGELYTTCTFTVSGTSRVLYVELNEDEGSCTVLEGLIGSYNELLANGTSTRSQTLVFNGKGGAVLTMPAAEDGGDPVTYDGTVSETTDKVWHDSGRKVYAFTADGVSFKFILIVSGTSRYFARYNETVNGTYTGKDGTLQLDGFSFLARYTDSGNQPVSGVYSVTEENVIRFSLGDNTYRYFDLGTEKSFTLRGTEAGDYMYIDNMNHDNIIFHFDGYGNLTVNRYDETNDRELVGEGTYERTDGKYTLVYLAGSDKVTVVGQTGYLIQDNTAIPAFFRENKNVVSTFVDVGDRSVLILDTYGNVRKYLGNSGTLEAGTYTLISEELFYYVNSAQTDACIYRYDRTKATVRRLSYVEHSYYTAALDSLLFSRYGFMIIDGETRCYYELKDNDILVYKREPGAENANEYDFTVTNIGPFKRVMEQGGKQYIENEGTAIFFNRQGDAAEQEKYPIVAQLDENGEPVYASLKQLRFAPAGTPSFTVAGQVDINGRSQACTVVREIVDGKPVTYVIVNASVGYFRFDIEITYTGTREDGTDNNEYRVIALSHEIDAISYTYAYYYTMFYMYFGASFANTFQNSFGTLLVREIFDETGKTVVESYVNAEFGPDSNILDEAGEPIKLKKAPFTQRSSTVYTVEIEGKDYNYRINFQTTRFSALNVDCYALLAFTRVEKFQTADGYDVEVEHVLASESSSVMVGSFFNVTLSEDGEAVAAPAAAYIYQDTIYYLAAKTTGEGEDAKVVGYTYYLISLVPDTDTEVENEADRAMLPYKSASVEKIETTMVFDSRGVNYVDKADGEDRILLLNVNGVVYLAESTEYDAATETYTVSVIGGRKFSVKITENVAVIEEIVPEEE